MVIILLLVVILVIVLLFACRRNENFHEKFDIGNIGNQIIYLMECSVKRAMDRYGGRKYKYKEVYLVGMSNVPKYLDITKNETVGFLDIPDKWYSFSNTISLWNFGGLPRELESMYFRYWKLCRPILNRMFKKYLKKVDVKCPVFHFRCSDIPMNRHMMYHIPKRAAVEKMIRIVKDKGYSKIILLNCTTHYTKSKRNGEMCREFCEYYVSIFKEHGVEVVIQCNSVVEDMATMFYCPLLFSMNNSSFSFVVGVSRDPGTYVSTGLGKEYQDRYKCLEQKDVDWIVLSDVPLLHREVDNYYKFSEVREKLEK